MIVKTNYADVRENMSITVSDGNKDVKSLYKIVVTKDNIKEAVEKYANSDTVIAFQFESVDLAEDLNWLATEFPTFVGKPIIFIVNLKEYAPEQITYDVLAGWARYSNPTNSANPAIRLVFKCPDAHNDLPIVYRISTEFKNTAFCGGYYLNHTFCNLGCIRESDFPYKINSKLIPTIKGCTCNYAEICSDFNTIDFDTAEIEYTELKSTAAAVEKTVKVKKKSPAGPKEPVAKKAPKASVSFQDMLSGLSGF